MKHLHTITGITVLLLIGACKKEYISADPISCPAQYDNHTKNTEFQAIVDRYFDAGLPGISVLIHTPEEGFWEGSAGFANIEDQVPMTPCHIHYAASISKSFTAVAILQQVEQGIISLDSRIEGYLDEEIRGYIPNSEKLTIRHLLSHTSGLPDVIDIDFITNFFNDPGHYYSLEEILSLLDGKEALAEPGAEFFYADANFILLALILDRITGDHLAVFQENIFIPLGLENTTYEYTINHNTVDDLVSAYIDTYSDGSLENVTDWEDAITSYLKGSGGMTTNSYDLAMFIQGVFDHSLVTDETLEMIRSDTVHNPLADQWMNDSYSLGFMVIHDAYGTWYGHAGRDPGAAGYMFYNPEHQVTLVAMTNISTFFSQHYTRLFYGELWTDLCDAIFK